MYARLGIFTAMKIHVVVFWDMTLCSNTVRYFILTMGSSMAL